MAEPKLTKLRDGVYSTPLRPRSDSRDYFVIRTRIGTNDAKSSEPQNGVDTVRRENQMPVSKP